MKKYLLIVLLVGVCFGQTDSNDSDFQLHQIHINFGKIISVILMFAGMIFIGVLTVTLTTLMVGDESEKSIDTLRSYLDKRLNEIKK